MGWVWVTDTSENLARTERTAEPRFADVAYIASCREKAENIASRKASQNTIAALVPAVPEIFGGSADLAGSLQFIPGSIEQTCRD